jgi:hypothetical protein
MNIYIPCNYIPERTYVIDIILGEFLGLDYRIITQENLLDYKIILHNGNTLIVKDHFFKKFTDDMNYLSAKNIPEKINFIKNQFVNERDIPVIYGNDELIVAHDGIVCGIDIFASSFFMLARWEEYVNKIRDKHNRFQLNSSLAYKNYFFDRAVVNEYTEMLWNMLLHLGQSHRRKERIFKMLLTHDVDFFCKYNYFTNWFAEIVGDIVNRKNPRLALTNLKASYFYYINSKNKDPYDTFHFLMDISEKSNVKSHFLLMGKGSSCRFDNKYKANDNDPTP